MASDTGSPIAKAYVLLVPSLEGSQGEITTQLTGVANDAADSAGKASGETLGNAMATGLKAAAGVITAAVAAVTAAAVATGKAFIDAANSTAEWGNQIDKESQKMNMSAQGYQEWAFILEHAGASIDGMKTSMKKLTVAAEEGNDAFTALGISQEDLAAMSPEETWNATIAALQNVADEGERTALANQLLGKGAVELAPLFNMTAEETEALKDQLGELGGIMSDDAVKAAAEYEDEMQNMKTALTGVKNNMMSQFLPGMSQVMKGLSMVFSGQGGIEEIRAGLEEIISNIVALSPQFLEIAQVIVLGVLDGFAPMLPTLVSSIFSFLNQALNTVVGLIPQLLPVITTGVEGILSAVFDCLPMIISSLITLVEDVANWLASGDNTKVFVDSVIEVVTVVATSLADALPILLPAIVTIIGGLATALMTPENVDTILTAVLYIVGAVVVALVAALPSIGKVIVDYAMNIYNNIMYWGGKITGWLTPFINGIKTTFTNWTNNLKNAFTTAWTTIQSKVTGIINNITGFCTNVYNTLAKLPEQVIQIGKDLVTGLWNGISDKASWVTEKIKGFGTQITNAIKKQLGVASPSKVFAEIGGFMAEGLGVGWEDQIGDVEADMANSMNGLTGSMSAEVNAYSAGTSELGTTNTYNGGNISINVYGAEGQSVTDLADAVAYKLEEMTTRRSAVYG